MRLPRQNQRGTSCWWGGIIIGQMVTLSVYVSYYTAPPYDQNRVTSYISFSQRYMITKYTTITYKMFVYKPTPTAWEASATGSAGSCWPSWTCRDKHILGRAEAADHDDDHQQHQIHPRGAPMSSPPRR